MEQDNNDVIANKLNAILGIEVEEDNKLIEISQEQPSTDITIVEESDILPAIPQEQPSTDLDEDFEFARSNMKEISKVGMNAIKELSYVARDSQTPRIYEVLSKMMKDVSDINATIIDNHSKKISQQPVEEASTVKVNSIENAVFCTSADMLKRIKQNQHK